MAWDRVIRLGEHKGLLRTAVLETKFARARGIGRALGHELGGAIAEAMGRVVRARTSGWREVVVVPASVLVFRDGAPQAFVLPGGSERVVMRRLTAGARQDGMVEITEGLSPGERVVTAGAGFLVQGDLVRVAP